MSIMKMNRIIFVIKLTNYPKIFNFNSVPVGTIITAKFFGKEKKTFPLIVIGLAMNGLIITSLAYFAGGLFK